MANNDEQRDGAAAPNVAAVGLDAATASHPHASVAQPADPMAPAGPQRAPLFLTGPSTGPGPARVSVATPDTDGESMQLDATFRRDVGSVDTCRVNGVPNGVEATVTNLENGRSVECWTGSSASGRFDQIVLHPDRYQRIANFSDAPVHVEVTW